MGTAKLRMTMTPASYMSNQHLTVPAVKTAVGDRRQPDEWEKYLARQGFEQRKYKGRGSAAPEALSPPPGFGQTDQQPGTGLCCQIRPGVPQMFPAATSRQHWVTATMAGKEEHGIKQGVLVTGYTKNRPR